MNHQSLSGGIHKLEVLIDWIDRWSQAWVMKAKQLQCLHNRIGFCVWKDAGCTPLVCDS